MSVCEKELHIAGMTCVNCEARITRALQKLPGVEQVRVDYVTGAAYLRYDEEQLSFDRVGEVLEELDYELEEDSTDLSRTLSLLIIILGLYVALQKLGLLNRLVPSQLADSSMGYGLLFVTGLLTSVHCIAMCGGINLSQSLPKAGRTTLAPALLYNGGRVLSYTVIGFALGLVGLLLGGNGGSAVSTLFQGIIKLVAGFFMLISGLNLLGLFPPLRHLQLRLPALGHRAGTPLLIGLLNGLMPCGPLQSMQLVALASGSPFRGALSMLTFSLGTVPLMLGFGSLVAALGKRFARAVNLVGAVMIAVFGIAMLSQGGTLSGLLTQEQLLVVLAALAVIGVLFAIPFPRKLFRNGMVALAVLAAAMLLVTQSVSAHISNRSAAARVVDGVQYVSSTLEAGRYPEISVQTGLPVVWTIRAPAGSVNGCNRRMIIPGYGMSYEFSEGDNVIEFTPEEPGDVSYSCWMGMIPGTIHVS